MLWIAFSLWAISQYIVFELTIYNYLNHENYTYIPTSLFIIILDVHYIRKIYLSNVRQLLIDVKMTRKVRNLAMSLAIFSLLTSVFLIVTFHVFLT